MVVRATWRSLTCPASLDSRRVLVESLVLARSGCTRVASRWGEGARVIVAQSMALGSTLGKVSPCQAREGLQGAAMVAMARGARDRDD